MVMDLIKTLLAIFPLMQPFQFISKIHSVEVTCQTLLF